MKSIEEKQNETVRQEQITGTDSEVREPSTGGVTAAGSAGEQGSTESEVGVCGSDSGSSGTDAEGESSGSSELQTSGGIVGKDSLIPTPAGPTHPLTMQFMELEQALDSTDASFKVKLRDIHRHLGKDPDLVTQMTEAEIALVVKGLVIFANAEIVEPAKAKTVKAATAAAKKKVISADDL